MRSLIAAKKSSGSFFVRLGGVSLPRPERHVAPGGAAVNDGRRPPPRRREASLKAASTVPLLNEVGLACCNRISARVVRSNPFICRSLACRGHGSLRGRYQIASSWVLGAVTPQCEDANCSAMVAPANNA
jgi:hypothetical protein